MNCKCVTRILYKQYSFLLLSVHDGMCVLSLLNEIHDDNDDDDMRGQWGLCHFGVCRRCDVGQ